jgi:hypothetical protein
VVLGVEIPENIPITNVIFFDVYRRSNYGGPAEQEAFLNPEMVNSIREDLQPIRAYMEEQQRQQQRGKNLSSLLAQLEDISSDPFLEPFAEDESLENEQLVPIGAIKQEASPPRQVAEERAQQHPPPAAEEAPRPELGQGRAQEPRIEEPSSSANQEAPAGNGGLKRRLTIDRQEKDEYQTGHATQEAKKTKKGDTTITMGRQATTVKISTLEEEWRLDTRTQTDRLQSNHLPYLRSTIN